MPGFLLHVGATVLCAHGGQAQPTAPNPRVLVSGQPIVTMAAPYVVAGCAVRRRRRAVAVRHRAVDDRARRGCTSNGQPVLLLDSQAVCAPNGTPLTWSRPDARDGM